MTRSTSNFNEKKYLIDEATVSIMADFCFPNGVPVMRIDNIVPGMPMKDQCKKVQDNINEIFYHNKNLREDMFCF